MRETIAGYTDVMVNRGGLPLYQLPIPQPDMEDIHRSKPQGPNFCMLSKQGLKSSECWVSLDFTHTLFRFLSVDLVSFNFSALTHSLQACHSTPGKVSQAEGGREV